MSTLPPCCPAPDPQPANALAEAIPLGPYAQLLALGAVMILGHCGGMCGPLVLSFRFGLHQSWQGRRLVLAGSQLAAYQGGRATIYAGAGAIGGLIGGWLGIDWSTSLEDGFASGGRWIFPLIALAFLALAAKRLIPRMSKPVSRSRPGPLSRLGSGLARRLDAHPIRNAYGLGLLMAFLPCLIPAWALGLAVSSGSALHGTGLMLLLVLMTTPALLPFALLPGFLPKPSGALAGRLQTGAFLLSGAWMTVISLAAHDLIPHATLAIGSAEIRWW
ncbi:MAG: urease accessory protein UreH domain-containing protein [Planctomycetota bacterium]